jgi:hypothetical protein
MDDDRMTAVALQARETTLRRLAERPLEIRTDATAAAAPTRSGASGAP